MARMRDWRRKQRRLHRGREKYTDWWHAYIRSDDYFIPRHLKQSIWRRKHPRRREERQW